MYGKIVFVLLGLSLFIIAACGPATATAPPTDAPAVESTADASTEQSAPSAEQSPTADTSAAAADDNSSANESVPGVQPLDWDVDEENCIIPGLVITGQNADIPPCVPVPASEEDEGVQEETDTMPQESTPLEPAQPQEQDAHTVATALAVADLAHRLGIPAAEIDVREVRAVTWPDTSMGCPEPDVMYAQMMQEGLLIRLYAGGEMYFYHSGGDQPPFLCEQTMQLKPPDPRTPENSYHHLASTSKRKIDRDAQVNMDCSGLDSVSVRVHPRAFLSPSLTQ